MLWSAGCRLRSCCRISTIFERPAWLSWSLSDDLCGTMRWVVGSPAPFRQEPVMRKHLISQLAHVELLTPDIDQPLGSLQSSWVSPNPGG
jgi:hypothetical protein